MKKIVFINTTNVSGVVYKRGDVRSFRLRTANSIIQRGDAYEEQKIKQASPVVKTAEAKPVLSFRQKAHNALDVAGVDVDGRWGDSTLRDKLKEYGLEV